MPRRSIEIDRLPARQPHPGGQPGRAAAGVEHHRAARPGQRQRARRRRRPAGQPVPPRRRDARRRRCRLAPRRQDDVLRRRHRACATPSTSPWARALPRPGVPPGSPHPGARRRPAGPSPATSWRTSMTEIRHRLQTALARRRHHPRRLDLAARAAPGRGRRRLPGYDYVCVDMQHGLSDYEQTWSTSLHAMARTPTVPIVRVPWNEQGIIGRVLDAGAMGVIIPMVNSPEEAAPGRRRVPLRAAGRPQLRPARRRRPLRAGATSPRPTTPWRASR